MGQICQLSKLTTIPELDTYGGITPTSESHYLQAVTFRSLIIPYAPRRLTIGEVAPTLLPFRSGQGANATYRKEMLD